MTQRPESRRRRAAAPEASVIMPVYEQAPFAWRALGSLSAQTEVAWELIMVDDGSSDDPAGALSALGGDRYRARLVRHGTNAGLGAACNAGLDAATAPVVAYLPADDVWGPGHLAALLAALESCPDALLAHTGVRRSGVDHVGAPPGRGLQLVQVAHRQGGARWIERDEVESDDLDRLMWRRLCSGRPVAATGRVSCEWVDHPRQRHRAMLGAEGGGVNTFRSRYRVGTPLRLETSDGASIDEGARYRPVRDLSPTPPLRPGAADGLTVLLVGELAYNPDRVLALHERGHRLLGLWIDDPLGWMSVGPQPFGHVQDLPRRTWREAVDDERPDVAYCLLNWRSLPLALEVAERAPDLPLVWHFKEAPQRCLARGDWASLATLWARADHVVLSTEEEAEWMALALPGRRSGATTSVIDGDLPSARWFAGTPAGRLSDVDGEIHTVVLGRPLGLDRAAVAALGGAGVHLHVHGGTCGARPEETFDEWAAYARPAAPGRVHVHPSVGPEGWRSQLSCYDAGWLHATRSTNGGDLRLATWDDLNCPARLPTLAAAGIPALLPRQDGHRVAVNRIVAEHGTGVTVGSDDLGALTDATTLDAARRAMEQVRGGLTFDRHADRLVDVFRSAIAGHRR